MSAQTQVTSLCDVAHSGRENLHQFLPILLWRYALSSSIMILWALVLIFIFRLQFPKGKSVAAIIIGRYGIGATIFRMWRTMVLYVMTKVSVEKLHFDHRREFMTPRCQHDEVAYMTWGPKVRWVSRATPRTWGHLFWVQPRHSLTPGSQDW